jgi:hypothetical protein
MLRLVTTESRLFTIFLTALRQSNTSLAQDLAHSNLQHHSSILSWLITAPTHKLERNTQDRATKLICNESTNYCCTWVSWTHEYRCLGSPFIAPKGPLAVAPSLQKDSKPRMTVGTPDRVHMPRLRDPDWLFSTANWALDHVPHQLVIASGLAHWREPLENGPMHTGP